MSKLFAMNWVGQLWYSIYIIEWSKILYFIHKAFKIKRLFKKISTLIPLFQYSQFRDGHAPEAAGRRAVNGISVIT